VDYVRDRHRRYGGNRDFTDNFGEDFAALCVLCAFVAADIGPFTVAGHNESSTNTYLKIMRRSVTSDASQPNRGKPAAGLTAKSRG